MSAHHLTENFPVDFSIPDHWPKNVRWLDGREFGEQTIAARIRYYESRGRIHRIKRPPSEVKSFEP